MNFYDTIHHIETTLGITLTPEQEGELLSWLMATYNAGVRKE